MAPVATRRRPRLDRRTRAARAERRDGREALLEAAAKVFAERGYRDASVDEIADEAGFSKGALYWHFDGKQDLFFALLEERIDAPLREAIGRLASAPPEHDMAVEGSRFFAELLATQRNLMLLDQEYRALAVRDPDLRARYTKRRAELRETWAEALAARLRHRGVPPLEAPEEIATALLALASGLTEEHLVDPKAVPDDLLGRMFALVYAGHVATAEGSGP
jgi:AcrR family transcriptional regulator